MHGFLKTRFADRWLWMCPILSILLAAVVLMFFGFTFWGGLLAPRGTPEPIIRKMSAAMAKVGKGLME